MKSCPTPLFGLGTLAGFILWGGALTTMARSPEVLIVSEAFGHAGEETRPTEEHPIRYHLLGGAQMDIGGKIRGEKMPAPAALEKLIHHMLKSQGVHRATAPGANPDIIVTYAYGSVAVDLEEEEQDEVDLTAEDAGDISAYAESLRYARGGDVRHLIGASRMKNQRLDYHTAALFQAALTQDRLYITVSAMDFGAQTRREREIVRPTRLYIEYDRNELPDAMDLMLISAAPPIRAESGAPVIPNQRANRDVRIEIGDREVVETPAPQRRSTPCIAAAS